MYLIPPFKFLYTISGPPEKKKVPSRFLFFLPPRLDPGYEADVVHAFNMQQYMYV